MLGNFSLVELAAIAISLEEEEQDNAQQNNVPREWVHKSLLKRKTEGEFFTLYKELMDDDSKFHQYFRMSISQFNELLAKLGPSIAKQDTRFRKAITPIEKLAVCLR